MQLVAGWINQGEAGSIVDEDLQPDIKVPVTVMDVDMSEMIKSSKASKKRKADGTTVVASTATESPVSKKKATFADTKK